MMKIRSFALSVVCGLLLMLSLSSSLRPTKVLAQNKKPIEPNEGLKPNIEKLPPGKPAPIPEVTLFHVKGREPGDDKISKDLTFTWTKTFKVIQLTGLTSDESDYSYSLPGTKPGTNLFDPNDVNYKMEISSQPTLPTQPIKVTATFSAHLPANIVLYQYVPSLNCVNCNQNPSVVLDGLCEGKWGTKIVFPVERGLIHLSVGFGATLQGYPGTTYRWWEDAGIPATVRLNLACYEKGRLDDEKGSSSLQVQPDISGPAFDSRVFTLSSSQNKKGVELIEQPSKPSLALTPTVQSYSSIPEATFVHVQGKDEAVGYDRPNLSVAFTWTRTLNINQVGTLGGPVVASYTYSIGKSPENAVEINVDKITVESALPTPPVKVTATFSANLPEEAILIAYFGKWIPPFGKEFDKLCEGKWGTKIAFPAKPASFIGTAHIYSTLGGVPSQPFSWTLDAGNSVLFRLTMECRKQ